MKRANRTVTEAIRTLIFTHAEDWSKYLAILEYATNNTAHSRQGIAPFEHNYGYSVSQMDGQPSPTSRHQLTATSWSRSSTLTSRTTRRRPHKKSPSTQPSPVSHRVELDMCHHALLREDRIVTNAECHHTTKLDAKYREPFLVATKMDFDNYRLPTILHSSVPSVHISDLLPTQPPKRTCNVQH